MMETGQQENRPKGLIVPEGRMPRIPKALRVLFSISFKQFFGAKRTRFLLVLAYLPVLLSFLWLYFRLVFENAPRGYTQFSEITTLVFFGFLSIIVTFLYGIMAIAGEVEEGTLFYPLSRPVPKHLIIIGKYLGLAFSSICILLPPLILLYLIFTLPYGVGETLRYLKPFALDVEILVLAALAYGSVFLFLGTLFKRAFYIGIIYALVWEMAVPFIPSFFRRLTVGHYLHSISPHINEKNVLIEIFGQTTPYWESIISLLIISAVFLALSIFFFRRKEYIPATQT